MKKVISEFKEFVSRGNVMDMAVKVCPFCKSEIDIRASRCPHCTSNLETLD